jgi:hypothetical protein
MRIELWEFNPSSRTGQEYLGNGHHPCTQLLYHSRSSVGQVLLEKEEVERLCGSNYAVETTLFLDRNPFKPAKEQTMVRGKKRLEASGAAVQV